VYTTRTNYETDIKWSWKDCLKNCWQRKKTHRKHFCGQYYEVKTKAVRSFTSLWKDGKDVGKLFLRSKTTTWAFRQQVIARGWWTARRIAESDLGFPDSNRRCCYVGQVHCYSYLLPLFLTWLPFGDRYPGDEVSRRHPLYRLVDERYQYAVSFWSQ
jgi:hypothetical protein